jgi:hypothetical protein
MSLHVDVRTEGARLALSRLRSDVRGPALVRALNRTAVTVRAESARAMRVDMRGGTRVSDLKRAIGIERATTLTLTTRVVPSRRMTLPLTAYPTMQSPRGIVARVGEDFGSMAHAFLARMRGKPERAWLRVPPGTGNMPYTRPVFRQRRVRQGRSDLPIAQLRVPLAGVFVQRRITQTMNATAKARFSSALAQEVRFRTGTP